MIEFIKTFSNIFIELITIIFLWSKLFLKEESNLSKNLSVIFISSIAVTFIDLMDINTVFGFLITIFAIKFLYCKKLIKTILEFVILGAVLIILQLIGIFFLQQYINEMYSERFMSDITINILILIIAILGYYLIFNKRKKSIQIIDSKVIYYFSINIGMCLIISKIIWEYNKNIILYNVMIYIVCLVIIFLVQIYLFIYISKIIEEKRVLEVQKEYSSIIEATIDEVKRKQHDFKNYINTINGMIEVTDEKLLKSQLKEYIKSSISANKNIEDILYINNTIIKAIVYNKKCEAERLKIKFLYNVKDKYLENKLRDYEISDILGNLLNNAFEAVQIQEEYKNNIKTVILNILIENNKSIIEVKNNGIPIKEEQINSIFKSGFSTKEGKNRGYGLYNVKKIVKGKGGDIQMFFDEDYTVFKIII
ncbi:putative histidine kinase [Clostridium pasteurianum DSM 525 = ATCC 6013]|uniref:Putative histidine kinase n=1 Tax=Clostridium pasteurianum DSM 525 = ATCC 6013 TaxID=1262449 RepID=A0A0H3J979_CLOPA|nr:GHKL domain-containing protein [Clostridium pasteurianum]AJA48573.1 putative histidine kinase [Clostridium pasteurianum DSM 525 = ATCC 6013]AJA52561.1 putative histidine kinase [Clostridium pasteurianum DSM 525 = ATCC 6013]AOZ75804.1 hypothetical protein AQ983_12160 [Clostridium pasteurianum DSM 525 = ATCC 6013]AOZ79600.1 hypothetical protein AQ984_12155 [Clostridium pasteurianum]ELP57949.1 putative histidine kinase [Clostridium pasteurianum DSM 525 = ATCC 6013]